MIQLLKIALHSKKYLVLLIFTVIASLLVSVASQTEAFAMGLLTNQGPDTFSLFANETKVQDASNEVKNTKTSKFMQKQQQKRVKANDISMEDITQKWQEIDQEGKGYITKADAANYMGRKKKFNLLNSVMHKTKEKYKIVNNAALLIIIMSIVALFRVSCVFLNRYLTSSVGIYVSKSLRERYFKHLQTLPMSFFQKQSIGGLSARITGDAGLVADSIISFITNYFQMPFTFITSLIILFKLSPQLTMIIFLGLPLIGLPIYFLSRAVRRLQRKMQVFAEQFAQILIDYLAGVQTVKLFNMEKFSARKYEEMNNLSTRIEEKISIYGYVSRPILHMIGTFFIAIIIIYGLCYAKMGVSELVIYIAVMYLFYEPIKKFGEENVSIQRGLAAAERTFAVLDEKSEIEDKEDAIDFTNFKDKIEFKNVWFKYDEKWVLKDINFTVEKGQKVAFVGPTGAGKSTIAQLIPRLYDVQKGSVEVDGVPVTDYAQESLRDGISFVAQKPFLFFNTVTNNICHGRDYSEEEVKTAAKRAYADVFIEQLPEKYDTLLAEMGKSLSGGQQQRLAIARALVKKAPILIMDEATSALDSVSENKIRKAIHELRGSVTQIIIAHRLSTIEDADKIIYLEYGSIISEGTKDELYANCDGFKGMWDMMFKREMSDASEKGAELAVTE